LRGSVAGAGVNVPGVGIGLDKVDVAGEGGLEDYRPSASVVRGALDPVRTNVDREEVEVRVLLHDLDRGRRENLAGEEDRDETGPEARPQSSPPQSQPHRTPRPRA
jgi:hypothetical protein